MHHARGLVRRAGRRALQTLEAQAAPADSAARCVRPAVLQDVAGHTRVVPLLHSGALLRLTAAMKREEALEAVAEVTRLVSAEASSSATTGQLAAEAGLQATHSSRTSEAGEQTLYVKECCADTAAELHRRQLRFLSKLRGRLVSSDSAAVGAALEAWLQAPPTAVDDAAVAMYRGVVEALAATDPPAAIALAINPSLPSLTAGASAALAALVELHTPSAVHAFLESFASKDELTLAAETTATHLAVRLRKELSRVREAKDGTHAESVANLLAEATRFNVDPGVIYPTEPAAIQRWADQFVRPDMLPAHRARLLLEHVRRRMLLPRRVSVDALSVWTLTDLERPWMAAALATQSDSSTATGPSLREAREVLHTSAYQLALKDAKRNLIDNRLLHVYAAALSRGDVSPLDPSFAAFLEECGECHSDGSEERPATVDFTLPHVPAGVPLLRALRDLAPQCSYWCALLDHAGPAHVSAFTAPLGEVRVRVQLPAQHECVAAARDGRVPLPALPLLYEDADVLVVDKPAGLATSRHGLSCTQAGTSMTDLIAVLLATRFRDGRVAATQVFRQGQVHRLDAETSGCLLIAKSNVAADSLRHQMGTSAAFSHHTKVYHALCVVLEPSLHNVKLHDVVSDPADPKIRTHYRVIRFFPRHRVAWVECRIQQGKKHQIRRHLASRGLPLLADVEHGGAACCQAMMSRVALHAHSLSFIHPVSAETVTVVAPLPADFRSCLAQLQ